eukprot:GHVR01138867.1.p1 GENE.GHVR01138867.1~~GHVR01138867.1.p1  ORF type:complete len:152 (+),score=16.54 GHVR01138867.1:138-593(+)
MGVSTVFLLLPLTVAVCGLFIQRVSTTTGRVYASIFSKIAGLTFFILFLCVEASVTVMIAFFLFRAGFSNACGPLNRSLVTDYTSCRNRGKWLALETLSSSTWSGSAVLGGWLSDSYGYTRSFYLTAMVYSVALLVYAPLIFIVRFDKNTA